MDTTHYYLFHGYAQEDANDSYRRFGEGPRLPKKIYVNTWKTALCIKPCGNFLISGKVVEIFRGRANLELIPCQIEKFFCAPYELGDFSHWDGGVPLQGDHELYKFVRKAPEVDRPDDFDGFWELVCFQFWQIEELYENCTTASVAVQDSPGQKIEVPHKAIEECAVFKHGGEVLIRDDLFDRVSHIFDQNFYKVAEIII